MIHRLLALGLALVLLFGPHKAPAVGQDKPYDGYCQDGKPVITRWDPSLDQHYEPMCIGNVLGLRQKQLHIEPKLPKQAPPPPPDWGRWADISLNGYGMVNPYNDVLPFVTLSTGRTLVPIRMVTEALGGSTEWDEATQMVTVRLGDKSMKLTIGEKEAAANGTPVSLDQPPVIWLNRTMVPLRVIVEAFGAEVRWTDSVSRVDILLPGVTCAPEYCLDYI